MRLRGRLTLRIFTCVAAMVVVSACHSSQSGAARQDTTSHAAAPDTTLRDLAPWLTLMATGVDTTTTLGAWMTAHPTDRVTQRLPAGMTDDTFCRSAFDSVHAGGRTWVRSAVFVIPQAPPGEALPDSGDVASHLCTLRALWLEFAAPYEQAAQRATSALYEHFSGFLGNALSQIALSGPATGNWQNGSSWIAGRKVVVVAQQPAGIIQRFPPIPATTVAISYMIGRDMDVSISSLVDQRTYPKVGPEGVAELARADSAISWSGTAALVGLRRIFAQWLDSARFDPRSEAPLHLPALDTVLERALTVLRDTAALTRPQRAAAFLAADIALHLQAPSLGTTAADSARRVRLESAGAEYAYDHYNDAFFYRRSLLLRSYAADSLSPAGWSAFAELLRGGWNSACSPAEVVERGEHALREGVTDPLIHVFVAQAYADRYRGASEEPDPDTLRLREPERRRAIEHYARALAGVRDPGQRRQLWDDAVHLMLGIPIANRYFCFGD